MLLLAFLTPPPSGAQSADVEVLAVVHRLFDGMRAADSAMVRPLFHPQARLITAAIRDGEPLARIEASIESFIQAIGRPRAEVWDERLANERVFIDGPLASVWADYTFHRGSVLSHCGVDHFLLVKDGTQWRILEVADTRRTVGCGG